MCFRCPVAGAATGQQAGVLAHVGNYLYALWTLERMPYNLLSDKKVF
jgi:hypothetical protein